MGSVRQIPSVLPRGIDSLSLSGSPAPSLPARSVALRPTLTGGLPFHLVALARRISAGPVGTISQLDIFAKAAANAQGSRWTNVRRPQAVVPPPTTSRR